MTAKPEPQYEASLTAALVEFQAERPRILKDAANSHFGNKYATLDQIESEVLPRLAKLGLAWSVLPVMDAEAGRRLQWRLAHVSGQEMSGAWPLDPGSPQQIGSQTTYYRRYMLCSVLGVSADDDDDGNQASETPAPAQDWEKILGEANLLTDREALLKMYRQCQARHAPDWVLKEIQLLGQQAAQGEGAAGE